MREKRERDAEKQGGVLDREREREKERMRKTEKV